MRLRVRKGYTCLYVRGSILWISCCIDAALGQKGLIAEGSSKESRQKRLVVKEKRKYNFKTATLHCFIDTAANNPGLYSFGGINLNSSNSKTTYVHTYVRTYVRLNLAKPWTASEMDIRTYEDRISIIVEACKESRQKRLVVKVKRKYNFNEKDTRLAGR